MNIGIEETVKCCVNRYTLNLFFVSSHQLSYATLKTRFEYIVSTFSVFGVMEKSFPMEM